MVLSWVVLLLLHHANMSKMGDQALIATETRIQAFPCLLVKVLHSVREKQLGGQSA